LEYFEYQSERINLVFEHSKKLISVIKELILIFEVEQIYSLMYSSCKQITYKMATEKIVKTYAYNLWICFLEKMGKNAFENSWNVKAYERPFDCRKSMIRTYVDFLVGKCERERQKSDRYKEKKVDQES
jgi:hypothetical protein